MAMNCNSVEDIIKLIMNRDSISYNEACICVEDCINELERVVARGGSYEEAEDVVYYALSLEPDFLEIILNELF